MSHRGEWKTQDFDDISWHDVHVHGFRIVENDGNDGSAELFLDIDYIIEWLKGEEHLNFVVAQATLQFHSVFGLKFSLDYVEPCRNVRLFHRGYRARGNFLSDRAYIV
jgi:hypothetical protein